MYLSAANITASQRLPSRVPSRQPFPDFLPDWVSCDSYLGPPRTIFLVFSAALTFRCVPTPLYPSWGALH